MYVNGPSTLDLTASLNPEPGPESVKLDVPRRKLDAVMLKLIRLTGRSRDGLVRMSHSRMSNYTTIFLMILKEWS